MAKAYQSGGTTVCYSVSVGARKGLTPVSMATQCYVYTCIQKARFSENIFWQSIRSRENKSLLSEEAVIAAWVFMPVPLLKFRYAFTTDNFTDNNLLISSVQKRSDILRHDKPASQVKN